MQKNGLKYHSRLIPSVGILGWFLFPQFVLLVTIIGRVNGNK